MARKKEISPDRILDAAEEVIAETGGRQFTLDAVAARAGVSKGGLVYSFATKDDLIAAALQREMARFIAAFEARAQKDGAEGNQHLLSYVDEVMSESDVMIRKAGFLMTALVHSPQALLPVQNLYRKIFGLFDPSTQAGRDARQAVLAVEGLFYLRALGLVPVSRDEWEEVVVHARETIRKSLS